MQRISSSTAVANQNGPGKTGFVDANQALGVPGTVVNAAWTNSMQEEVCTVIEAVGIVLNANSNGQLQAAINQMIANANPLMAWAAVDTGAANALAITISPVPAGGLSFGQRFYVKVAADCTGPSNIVVTPQGGAAYPAKAIKKMGPTGLADPAAGDLKGGEAIELLCDGTYMQLLDRLPSLPFGTAAFKSTGNTVLDPGTGALEVASPFNAKTAQASYTYATTDRGGVVRRANGGAAMTDTLPGATAGILPASWYTTIINSDASASVTLSVGAGGGQIDGGASITLGAGASLTVGSDGANYWSEKGAASLTGYAKLNAAQAWTKGQSATPVAISNATPAIDLSASNVFYWSLTASNTLPLPTNIQPGQSFTIHLIQPAAGGCTLGWNAIYKWPNSTPPTNTTTANARDRIECESSFDGTYIEANLIRSFG